MYEPGVGETEGRWRRIRMRTTRRGVRNVGGMWQRAHVETTARRHASAPPSEAEIPQATLQASLDLTSEVSSIPLSMRQILTCATGSYKRGSRRGERDSSDLPSHYGCAVMRVSRCAIMLSRQGTGRQLQLTPRETNLLSRIHTVGGFGRGSLHLEPRDS